MHPHAHPANVIYILEILDLGAKHHRVNKHNIYSNIEQCLSGFEKNDEAVLSLDVGTFLFLRNIKKSIAFNRIFLVSF